MSGPFAAPPIALAQKMFVSSATQLHPLGTKGETVDGRVFRYAKAGASNLVAGNAVQAAVHATDHYGCAVTATAAGATSVNVTLNGSTVAAANLYAEGYAVVDTAPGNGYAYRIASHPAIGAGGAADITLADEVQVALDTNSKITLVRNPYSGVVQAPTTVTSVVVGTAVYVISAAEFGWIQTGGIAPQLISGTPAIGNMVSVLGAAGAMGINTGTLAQHGINMVVGRDGKVLPVLLTID